MKTRNFTLLVSAIFLVIATFATSNSQVFAQSPCIAQVSYPAISSSYNPNIGMTVPVSATCSTYSGQLFAVGDAYDTTTNSDLGSVNTGLSSAGGGNFNGQLNFYLPATVQGDTVQISVSIYNTAFGNNGSLLATTSQAVTINGGYNQSYQNSYSYCPPGYSYVGGNCYPPSYSSNYNNYNNYYAYCPPGYSNIGGGCSSPGNYYYSVYRYHGNYYYHWYYHRHHWYYHRHHW